MRRLIHVLAIFVLLTLTSACDVEQVFVSCPPTGGGIECESLTE
jgi:hypothetical protein